MTNPSPAGSEAVAGNPGYNPGAYNSDWDDDDDDYTETKSFFRTSEFWFGMLVAVAVILAAYSSGDDSISREDRWRFVTAIAVGFMVSRGLAKAGSREPTDT